MGGGGGLERIRRGPGQWKNTNTLLVTKSRIKERVRITRGSTVSVGYRVR